MIFELNFRDRPVGGAVTSGTLRSLDTPLPPEEALDRLRAATKVAFLVHGFNVNENDGRSGLGLFAARERPDLPDHALVTVLWPGDHFLRAASYPFEGDDADDTADALASFIMDLLQGTSVYSFVGHSLGCRVVMETVSRLSKAWVDQVCLMAAAIDDDALADPKAYRNAASKKANRVAVLSSTEDRVLKLAYPLGDFLQSLIFFWRDDPGWALGLRGPHPADFPAGSVVSQIPESRGARHGHYIPAPSADGHEDANQRSAGKFSASVLRGDSDPIYP